MTTIPESYQDLLRPSALGALATIGPRGHPQVTYVGCMLDDDGVVKISASSARQKVKNLLVRPECSLLVVDPKNPMRSLEIRAKAHLEPDVNLANLAKLMKASGSDEDPATRDVPGETRYVIALEPVKVNASG